MAAHTLGHQPKDSKKGELLAAKRQQQALPQQPAGAGSRLRRSFPGDPRFLGSDYKVLAEKVREWWRT